MGSISQMGKVLGDQKPHSLWKGDIALTQRVLREINVFLPSHKVLDVKE